MAAASQSVSCFFNRYPKLVRACVCLVTLVALAALGAGFGRLIAGNSFPAKFFTKNWAIWSTAVGAVMTTALLAALFLHCRQKTHA